MGSAKLVHEIRNENIIQHNVLGGHIIILEPS